MATKTESYAIIAVGGKQYVVREGERLVVDRVGADEGKTFQPGVLFVGGDGKGELTPKTTVTARTTTAVGTVVSKGRPMIRPSRSSATGRPKTS